MTKICQQFGDALYAFGVRRVYGLPGEDHMALLDAFVAAGLDYCTAYNESSAAIMAGVDAQVTGLPGVVMLSLAPGVSNGVNGLLNAYLDEIPLILISGQHPGAQLPFTVRQAFNIEQLVTPLTKWQARITSDMDVPSIVGKAIDEAMSARPGPVYLELPDDVAVAEAATADSSVARTVGRLRGHWLRKSAPPVADDASVHELAKCLSAARHPVLIIGGRRRRVSPGTVGAFSAAYRVPVFTTSRQKGVSHSGSPWFAGTFLNGSLERTLLEQSDLVLLVDPEAFDIYNRPWNFSADAVAITSNDFAEWLSPYSSQVIVNPDAALSALVDRNEAFQSEWTPEDVSAYRSSVRATLLPSTITTFSAAHAVDAALDAWPRDGYVTADAGFTKPLVVMLSDLTEPDHFFASNALSTMGYSIPAGIAARRAGARPVLSFLGDGSLLMRSTELMVARDDREPAVFVTVIDGALTQIEVKQERRDLRTVGASLPILFCERLAEAYGIDGIDVDNADDLRSAVAKGLGGDRPMLIGAHIDPRPSRVLFDELRG